MVSSVSTKCCQLVQNPPGTDLPFFLNVFFPLQIDNYGINPHVLYYIVQSTSSTTWDVGKHLIMDSFVYTPTKLWLAKPHMPSGLVMISNETGYNCNCGRTAIK